MFHDSHINESKPRPLSGLSAWIITDGKAGMDVQCIGIAEALGQGLVKPVATRMAEISVLYRRHKPRLVLAGLGDDAVAIGAAVLAGRAVE